ncbi:cobalt ABC transporter permease [Roseospira visakhapatnamensis]|uniref:Nickel transport protein n=1 Tax=Roseospira visakhapatnamensis TaxID=390880 RepID=A0A7W6RAB3_9PROT|nr:cobalt ABC transporter permease [Roseospira visakhapatnamensis]MBB4264865.1 nickel transport protein [Roseospira visakhapatnamensis]
MMKPVSMLLVGALLMTTVALPARAHKVVASGYAAGEVIEGEVGFSNGDMAVDTPIEVFDPDGNKLGETRTDADGFFVFTPTQAVPHVFRANLGAGHVAEFTMDLDDLPGHLTAGAADPVAPGAIPSAGAPGPVAALPLDLTRMVADAVRAEVRPLRKELAAYKEKNDLQAVLGGIGYILGLFGLAFFLMARRRPGSGA